MPLVDTPTGQVGTYVAAKATPKDLRGYRQVEPVDELDGLEEQLAA
jgi:hypothetical protein